MLLLDKQNDTESTYTSFLNHLFWSVTSLIPCRKKILCVFHDIVRDKKHSVCQSCWVSVLLFASRQNARTTKLCITHCCFSALFGARLPCRCAMSQQRYTRTVLQDLSSQAADQERKRIISGYRSLEGLRVDCRCLSWKLEFVLLYRLLLKISSRLLERITDLGSLAHTANQRVSWR